MSWRGALLALAFVACGWFGASVGAGSSVVGADEPGMNADGGFDSPNDNHDERIERHACPDDVPGVDSSPCPYAAAAGTSLLAVAP